MTDRKTVWTVAVDANLTQDMFLSVLRWESASLYLDETTSPLCAPYPGSRVPLPQQSSLAVQSTSCYHCPQPIAKTRDQQDGNLACLSSVFTCLLSIVSPMSTSNVCRHSLHTENTLPTFSSQNTIDKGNSYFTTLDLWGTSMLSVFFLRR